MPLPQCSFSCRYEATYYFVDKAGVWRNGCNAHWRAESMNGLELGQYIAQRLHRTEEEIDARYPPREEIVVPSISTARSSPKTKREPRVFRDMEPSESPKVPREGSVLYITIEFCRKFDGATLAEIQDVIGEKHDALKLIIWAHKERGWGWKMGDDDRIRVLPQ